MFDSSSKPGASARFGPNSKLRGELALISYPLFLGLAPIFGKMAINGGADPFTVAALRTVAAVAMLWLLYGLFWRRYIFIYPAGLLGCIVVGTVNGIGSLFYYNGLSHLSASVAQLINATYLIFVVIFATLAGLPLRRRTAARIVLAMLAVALITVGNDGRFDPLGVGLMLGNAILFASTFVLSQRILYEMPSQTVTLYVLTTMATIVVMARAANNQPWIPLTFDMVAPILALGCSTALSRLAMFFSVKRMGSMQTVLLGISEAGVSLILAAILLGDQLSGSQWLGVACLATSLLLMKTNDLDKLRTGEMRIFKAIRFGIQPTNFNRIAFIQAFNLSEEEPLDITPDEMAMIRKMMEAPGRYETPRAVARRIREEKD
jgi:drug/metabolite transporter (DMT)-like permease